MFNSSRLESLKQWFLMVQTTGVEVNQTNSCNELFLVAETGLSEGNNDSCDFSLISSLPKPAHACEEFVSMRDAASIEQPLAEGCCLSWL